MYIIYKGVKLHQCLSVLIIIEKKIKLITSHWMKALDNSTSSMSHSLKVMSTGEIPYPRQAGKPLYMSHIFLGVRLHLGCEGEGWWGDEGEGMRDSSVMFITD